MAENERKDTEAEVAEREDVEMQAETAEQVEEVGEGPGAGEEGLKEQAEELEEINLAEELEKAQAQAAEYLDGWQRTQAEFSNYKKRQEAERAQTVALSNAALLRKLLPVIDDFERALGTLPSNLSQMTWIEGIVLIKHKLDGILESEGVKPIGAEGKPFDPRYHEAVTYEEAEGYEDGQIIGGVQRGYTLGERVLRPALVRVAKAPTPQPEDGESREDKDNDATDV